MADLKLAIPLFGKMATRTFHNATFRKILAQHGLTPLYFIGSYYFRNVALDPGQYQELRTEQYDAFLQQRALPRLLAGLRRFAVRTETTDLRFRETIESLLFEEAPAAKAWLYGAAIDALRHVPGIGSLAAWCEGALFPTHVHDAALRRETAHVVLTPGTGSFGFWNEGLFAREAQRLGLPVVAAITNYDNVVNMGFRGFMPTHLAVWSQLMADEAVRYQKIPANRIEVTGPVQYDRYLSPLPVGREEFLRSKGLDPSRQTILYAGGVNIARYFEIYRLLVDREGARSLPPCNLVLRPYPHVKLLGSPAWQILENLFSRVGGVYISNPLTASSDNLRNLVVADAKRDIASDDDLDELHCLLRFSDVMINFFSTISLEAAICDLPSIHVAYDSYTFGQTYNTLTAFQQRQTHNRRKLRLAAAQLVHDEQSLLQSVERYLADRSKDRNARQAYALSECGQLDGKGGERLAVVLRDAARDRA
jgi:hypothetical protein